MTVCRHSAESLHTASSHRRGKMQPRAMNYRLVLVLICLFLPLACSLTCSVSKGDDQTTYTISDLPPVQDDDWSYSYANSSDHVIAVDVQELPGLVLKNSKTSLTISGCIEDMIYTGTTVSTGAQYTANCSLSCIESAPYQNPQEMLQGLTTRAEGGDASEKQHVSMTTDSDKISRNHIIAYSFAAAAAVAVALLVCGLFCKFRGRIPWCRELGCRYTGVKTADTEAQPGQV